MAITTPMDIWQITSFTLLTALAATALMVPPGLALAWLLARRRFDGRVLVETFVSLPLIILPSRRDSSFCCSFPPRSDWESAGERRHRRRLHLARRRAGHDGHGVAALRAQRAGWIRAGRPALRGDRRHARGVAAARLLLHHVAAGASRAGGGRGAGLRARNWRVRRHDHDRWQHSGRHADVAGRDLHVHGDRPRS